MEREPDGTSGKLLPDLKGGSETGERTPNSSRPRQKKETKQVSKTESFGIYRKPESHR